MDAYLWVAFAAMTCLAIGFLAALVMSRREVRDMVAGLDVAFTELETERELRCRAEGALDWAQRDGARRLA